VTEKLPIVVLISGTGTNLQAICRAIDAGRCSAGVSAVISDNPAAGGLGFAEKRGIPTVVVRLADHEDRTAWDRALADRVAGFHPDLVVLAGFMKVVGPEMLRRFPGRIINIHPAILPLFPGTDGPGLALAAGVRLSGTTVHVVDSGVDTGPIIAQAAVRVMPNDDRESLHRRIQKAEHILLPEVIDRIARGEVELEPALRFRRDNGDDSEILFSLPVKP
jgi:phosphoribosylglycinamide formyltransferase-1